jgi:integrase
MPSLFPSKRSGIYYIQTCENGKVSQRSLKTKDRKIATYRFNEISNAMMRGDTIQAQTSITADQAFEEFKQSREGVLAIKTVNVVNQRIKAFLDDARIVKLSNITEQAVKDHLDRRIKGAKDAPGISNKTANHTIVQIGTFLTWCVRKKYLKENPLRFMKRYRLDPVVPRFLTHEEALGLINAAKASEIRLIVLIAIYTGMRWGEIERLTWEDFNFIKNEVIVRKSKTNKFRVIPIAEALRQELIPAKGAGIVCGYSYDEMDWRLIKIRDEIKIPHFRFHDLRHTFASMAIKSGVDLLTLSKWLGHSVISTTAIYAHLYNDHSQASMCKFCL